MVVLHVLVEAVVAQEGLAAVLARVALGSRVRVLVRLHVGDLAEGVPAEAALVRLLTCESETRESDGRRRQAERSSSEKRETR